MLQRLHHHLWQQLQRELWQRVLRWVQLDVDDLVQQLYADMHEGLLQRMPQFLQCLVPPDMQQWRRRVGGRVQLLLLGRMLLQLLHQLQRPMYGLLRLFVQILLRGYFKLKKSIHNQL